MNTFTHKGYGRIYCENEAAIPLVKDVIKELDEYEYSYMPERLIATFSDYPQVVYTHKFSDMDTDKLTAICWSRGIKIWAFDSGHNEYPKNELEPPK